MKRLLPLLLLIALRAQGATFVLAPDGETIRAASAVVVARVEGAQTRWLAERPIETVTTLRVKEVLRGDVGATLELVAPGGVVGEVGLAIAGSPRFTANERVLLLLERNARGEWTARNFIAGVFRFERDARGRELLLRDEELCGYAADGRPHREPQRLAQPFLRYVRAVAQGRSASSDYVVSDPLPRRHRIAPDAGPAASTYLSQQTGGGGTLGIRWNVFPSTVTFRSNGTQPGAPNGGLNAVNTSLSAWTNEPNSDIVYAYGGTTNRTSGFNSSDNVNSIQFNDPSNEIEGSFQPQGGATLAIGGAWFSTASGATHAFANERFYTIREADLVIQNGITGPGLTGRGFEHVVSHEFGHTLGFRHSDDPPAGGTSTSFALMNSTVSFNSDPTGASLQTWDREAAAAVYGSGPACVPPSIVTQPRSLDLALPQSITLTVAASGDEPFTYQWYLGNRGDTRLPLQDGRTPGLIVAPATTTSYWVRVTNGCDPPADSETATITIAGCPAIRFATESGGGTILEGRSFTLTAIASGGTISYQWFANGITITGQTGPTLTVSPRSTTTYVSRATNSCGASGESTPMTIEVLPCDAAAIVVQPAGGEVVLGEPATLYADAEGTAPLAIQWYEGSPPDVSRPLVNATTESIDTPALFAPASFWVRVTNECGSIDSAVAPISIAASCRAPSILIPPASRSVFRGERALLTVNAGGTGLRYRWYQGPIFDFTRPVGGPGPTLLTPEIFEGSQFWVRIENGCGVTNSATIAVTPNSSRRRAVGR